MPDALGNAVATLVGYKFCIFLSYSGLSGPEESSYIHGPAPIGENASVLFGPLSTGTVKNDCFYLDDEQIGYLEKGYLYFNGK
jgi:hypothetical protein